uniref:Uncharacterized protein n=1 Tax=Suricata suricatta TaxID=37032 RepID=A0A673UIP5_SURSU
DLSLDLGAGLRYLWLAWDPLSLVLELGDSLRPFQPSLCLITGGMASRLCVNTASCRPWARPSSRELGLPAPSPQPSSTASTGAGRWLARLDSGHEEWGPVGRAGRPRLRAGPGVRPRTAQGLPETEVLLHCGCRRARGRQGRRQSGVWEQLGLGLRHAHQTPAPGAHAQSG